MKRIPITIFFLLCQPTFAQHEFAFAWDYVATTNMAPGFKGFIVYESRTRLMMDKTPIYQVDAPPENYVMSDPVTLSQPYIGVVAEWNDGTQSAMSNILFFDQLTNGDVIPPAAVTFLRFANSSNVLYQVQRLVLTGDEHVEAGTWDIPGPFTISCRFLAHSFPEPYRDARLLSKATSTASDDHVFMLSAMAVGTETRLRGRLRSGGTTTTFIAEAGNLTAHRFHDAEFTWDGQVVTLILDEQVVMRAPWSGPLDQDPTVPVAVGGQPTGAGVRYWDGEIELLTVKAL